MAFRVQDPARADLFDAILPPGAANEALRRIDLLVDWGPVRDLLAQAYDQSGQGAAGTDPVVLFKMLILEELYCLSDVQASREAADRISFRRFLGLGAGDAAPDDTTLVKFRKRLRPHGLLDEARKELDRQLAAKDARLQPGKIKVVDATVIEAATRPPAGKPKPSDDKDPKPAEEGAAPEGPAVPEPGEAAAEEAPKASSANTSDPDAAWGGKRGRLKFGYKLHAAICHETGRVLDYRVTPANVADTRVFKEFFDGSEDVGLGDKGYDSKENRDFLGALGIADGIMRRVLRHHKGTWEEEWIKSRNSFLSKVRAPAEGAFASLKRWRRLGRAVYKGLARMAEHAATAILTHNLLRSVNLTRERRA